VGCERGGAKPSLIEGLLERHIGIEKYFSVIINSPFVKNHYPLESVFFTASQLSNQGTGRFHCANSSARKSTQTRTFAEAASRAGYTAQTLAGCVTSGSTCSNWPL
jgi:hypothetical protein